LAEKRERERELSYQLSGGQWNRHVEFICESSSAKLIGPTLLAIIDNEAMASLDNSGYGSLRAFVACV